MLPGGGLPYPVGGRPEVPIDRLGDAARIGDETGELELRTATAIDLATALLAVGRCAEAAQHYRAALSSATGSEARYEQARALMGRGSVHRAAGEYGPARRDWRRALRLFTELAVPEAETVREELAGLDGAAARAAA